MLKSNILAHRGCWKNKSDKNSAGALKAALIYGFGIETDLRDLAGKLVISHDPPINREMLSFELLLGLIADTKSSSRIALNIKADGLQTELQRIIKLKKAEQNNYFAFDMSIPDSLGYNTIGFPNYIRLSEYEADLSLLSKACGVWVDNFTGGFPQIQSASKMLNMNKRVALVSPELHGRHHMPLWQEIRNAKLHETMNFELCTDFPMEAHNYFSEAK